MASKAWEAFRIAAAAALGFLAGGMVASSHCHAQQVAKPTPVNLGRDMTLTTEHSKPRVGPPVVRVQIAAPKPPAAPKPAPVKLGEPVKDGARW